MFAPLEASGNHQVKNEKQLSFELPDDALPHSTHTDNDTTDGFVERRLDRSQQKRRREPDALKRPSDDTRRQSSPVELNVWKLGHTFSLSGSLRFP